MGGAIQNLSNENIDLATIEVGCGEDPLGLSCRRRHGDRMFLDQTQWTRADQPLRSHNRQIVRAKRNFPADPYDRLTSKLRPPEHRQRVLAAAARRALMADCIQRLKAVLKKPPDQFEQVDAGIVED